MASPIPDSLQHLDRAIRAVGSQTAVGRLLGVSQNAVSRWARGLSPLPAKHVIPLEKASGVSRHDLDSVAYPREQIDSPSADAADMMEPIR